MQKDKCLYIRCSDMFLNRLNNLCKKYNLSQSTVLYIFVYTYNDALITNMKGIDYFKFLDKMFKMGKKRFKE